MRIRPLPALAIVAAVVALSTAGYQLATTKANESAEGSIPIPAHELRAPRLNPQSAEGEGQEEGQGAMQPNPDDTPLRLSEVPAERLIELAMHSPSAWTRSEALEELVARKSNQSFPMLLDRLADPDGDVRRVAADGLAELGNPSALTALERAFPAEAVAKTRRAIAQAIAELRPSGETRVGE